MTKNSMLNNNKAVGIGLYRILCMFAITVSFHLIGYGDLLKKTEGNLVNHFLILFLTSFTTFGINGFIIISAFFLTDAKTTIKKVIKFDIMVIFYSVIIGFAGLIFSDNIYKPDIIKTFFPILTSYYWYATSYVILLLLVPFLNMFIDAMDKRKFSFFIITITAIYEILCVSNITISSSKLLGHASHGILWFILLYFITAYIKLYMNKYKGVLWRVLFLSGLVMFTVLKYIETLNIGIIDYLISETEILNNNSILSLGITISGFLAFKDIVIDKNKPIVKILNHITPSVFGIYLIQENLLLRGFLWNNLNSLTRNYATSMALVPLLIANFAGFWVVSLMLTYIYQFLHKKVFIRVENYICNKISNDMHPKS